MTPTSLVLVSVGLGLLAGALITWAVFGARTAGRRRADAMRPELPEVAVELLGSLDSFAVILDASLSPVYANAAARDDARVSGEELRDPDFLRRARRVMSSGVTDIREPSLDNPADTVRVRIVRVQRRFLAVFAEDLGEEQRVNAMRRDFIANVSHELKTPIAAIGLLSEAVLEAADEPEIVRGFAKKLKKESRRLGDLSRDIIQLSEAQSSLQPEDRESVSLRAVLRSEVEAHQDFAAQYGVELVLTESAATDNGELGDATVSGRPSAIGAVVANLLSNAIRHSPDGGRVGIGIEIGSRLTKQDCIITVTDQGEGIAPEHLPRIFERFYRVDAARSREGGGTGLGLSIARHTMRAHGGDIEVWSQEGVGSTFTLSFPLLEDGQSGRKRKKNKRASAGKKPAKARRRTAPADQSEGAAQ
ncbi:sensor histidine kinase [Leucobacter soli]|uniref:Sensor-like histidine kinase SenX3 n=1 Tax=Leucobacter soli TaxID=2812850 RepID=A0A916JX36_9MICO|nr:ATP-binding protein [Leucobacter soli]CAG7604158.1 Adaptive-response sensory-kinase SasA [Leucobacter soli]